MKVPKPVRWLLGALLLAPLVVYARLRRVPAGRRTLVWGPTPILNHRYWSAAMRAHGKRSVTLMKNHYGRINRPEDFDLYFDDLVPRWIPRPLRSALGPLAAMAFVLRRASVLHIPFNGGPLGGTVLWRLEHWLLQRAGIPTVVVPHGGDIYRYSRIPDPVTRHGLLLSFPAAGRRELDIQARVEHWTRHATVILSGFTTEGLGRWDVPICNMVAVDLERWTPTEPGNRDGSDPRAPVRLLHAPNHRGVKGTEFIQRSVQALAAEGLHVELRLVEGIPNEDMPALMRDADIFLDQLILPGYGLAAIEALASGLPVVARLVGDGQDTLFRRYGFLDQCPIVASSPEALTNDLRRLATDPSLRAHLGRCGRAYAEAYHGYAAAAFLFDAIHRRVLHGEDVDLMNLFHPLLSPHRAAFQSIEHGLVHNRLPPAGTSETPLRRPTLAEVRR